MRLRDVLRLLRPLWRRVQLLAGRGVVRAANDAPGLQELQVGLLRGELRDRLERFGALGVSSVPLPGAEAVVVFLGGNRDHGLVVGLEDRQRRPKGLEAGETVLYCTANGSTVRLQADGTIILRPATGKVRVQGTLEADADVRDLTGGLGLSMAEMRERYNLHTHADPQGGTSGPPVPTMLP